MSSKQSAKVQRPAGHDAAGRATARGTPAKRLPRDESLVISFSVSLDPMLAIVDRHVKLSPAARQAIRSEWSAVARGGEVVPSSPQEMETVLTTEQAAKEAGVSRPYMVNLIDAGEVELHQMVGNQRRVLLSSVQRWRAKERSRQAKALARLGEDLDEEIFSK